MTPRFATIAPTAADLRGGVLPLGPLRGGPWLNESDTLRIEVPDAGDAAGGDARPIDAALSGDGPLFGESAQSEALASWYADAGLTAGGSLLIRRIGRGRVRVSPLGPRFRFIDLFAGIGGFRLGFEAAGECVFSSEIDADACDTYEVNFGDRPHGDITRTDAADVPEHDLLLGGFPCQAFSIIGKRRGFEDTRGTLFFDVARILKERRPAAAVLENVKQFRTHDGGRTCATVVNTLEELGYTTHVTVLNALNYGVAQRRERTFIVALRNDLETPPFRWPEPYPERADLAEILEPDDAVAPKLWGTEYIRAKRLARLREQGKQPIRPSIWHENKGGHIGQHPYSCALRANASHSYLLVNGERRPTGRELLRLQGFPDDFRIAVSHRALRKQCGNSVAVPVITEVAAAVRRVLAI